MPVSPLVRGSHPSAANTTAPSLLVASLIQTRGVSQDDTVDPDSRTIQGIVWSCLVTIFACTWIAIHPNLPDPQDSWWQQQRKRIGLMIVALAAPEVVLLWALKQRIAAAAIMKSYNRTLSDIPVTYDASYYHHRCADPSTYYRKRPRWCLSHGFFIQMGGFVLVYERTSCPIKALEISLLNDMVLKGDVDPVEISEAELADRSKGDFLTKLLVVLQTSWFMAQCITRWISKLPVTELEVMTFSFAVLNMITYGLWWEKPQNVAKFVRVPLKHSSDWSPLVYVRDRHYQSVSTLHFQSTYTDLGTAYSRQVAPISVVPLCNPDPSNEYSDSTRASGASKAEMDITELTLTSEGYHSKEMSSEEEPRSSSAAIPHDPSVPCSHQQQSITAGILDSTSNWRPLHCIASTWLRTRGFVITGAKYYYRPICHLLSTIWKAKAFDSLVGLIGAGPDSFTSIRTLEERARHLSGCGVGVSNAADTMLSATDKTILTVFGIMIGLLFGGLHLLAFQSAFPTQVEARIWRVSTLYTMIYPVVLSFPLSFFLVHQSRFQSLKNATIYLYRLGGRWPMRLVMLVLPLYVVARLAIVIIAFITLRALPPGALKDISWSSFFPHL